MFIIKVMLILLWFIGGYIFFVYLPRPQTGTTLRQDKTRSNVATQPRTTGADHALETSSGSISTQTKSTQHVNSVGQVDSIDAVEVQEEKEEDVDFTNVEIFSKTLNLNLNFYESLNPALKEEFDRYYVLDHEQHLVKTLVYTPKGDNQAFFKYVFNHFYTYRKLISSGLISVLTEELIRLAEGNPKIQTILYEIATRTAYFRRKDGAYLTLAEDYSTRDIQLHRTVFKSSNMYVYSYTRLAIILEKKKQFTDALMIVEEALRLNLSDKTVNGYQGRRVRILDKQRKAM
jgi:hypothetical protein